MSPLLSPSSDLHAWKHDVLGESSVVAQGQEAGGCWPGLGPQQVGVRWGHLPAKMGSSENMPG